MIAIDLIDVPPGSEINPEAVESLAQSLKMDGLLHEIGVRPYTTTEVDADPTREGRYALVFGRHRLAAAKSLGWTQIQ